jgi:ketosteroid isomerase-like protein
MFRGPIEDRLKIRELFDSYSDSVTRRALDDYLDCWTEDGTRLGDGGEARGTEQLRAHWNGVWKALSRMAFVTQIGAIEVDGDRAYARSYCLETLRFHNGATHRLVGAYEDELRRVDGTWRFRERKYRVLVGDEQPAGSQERE